MSISPQKNKSVHDYLDQLFEGKDPSKESVVLAKKAYWKAYNLNLIRQRRKQNHEFSVTFSKSEFKMIQGCLQDKEAVSQCIRRMVLLNMNGSAHMYRHIDTAIIEQQLFLITDYLEEIIENEWVINTKRLQNLEIKTQVLHQLISQEFDNKDTVI